MAEAQNVTVDVVVELGRVGLHLRSAGVGTIPISVDAQAAFDLGEKLARAAHEARFGVPLQSDESYLREQINRRTTEDYRRMLVRKLEIMLNSTRADGAKWSNERLAAEIVDIVLSRVLPS